MGLLAREWQTVKLEKGKAMGLLAVAGAVIVSPVVLPVLAPLSLLLLQIFLGLCQFVVTILRMHGI